MARAENLQGQCSIGKVVQRAKTIWSDIKIAICQGKGDLRLWNKCFWVWLCLADRLDRDASFREVSALFLLLDCRIKVDSWGDEVDVLLNMSRYAVVFTGQMVFAGLCVGVNAILRVKECLGLVNCGIELDPAHAVRHLDAVFVNAGVKQPKFDSIYRVWRRCKN